MKTVVPQISSVTIKASSDCIVESISVAGIIDAIKLYPSFASKFIQELKWLYFACIMSSVLKFSNM